MGVKSAIIELLRNQSHQKSYEKYLEQNKNCILLNSGWVEIDEESKEQIFLKQLAKKVKEEYLEVKQER